MKSRINILERIFHIGAVAILGVVVSHSASAGNPTAGDELLAAIPGNFQLAAIQYEGMLKSLKDDPQLPRTYEEGHLKTVKITDWTSGFFPGSLWYLYEYTHKPEWQAAAKDYTGRLESIKDFTGDHDVGFMLGCSYGNGYRLTGDKRYRSVLAMGAKSLATRFEPKVGMIRSWSHGSWKYPVIIDNMMNLELLTWASREGGGAKLLEIATSHADLTSNNHFREDSSSWHLVDYDPQTGAILGKQTVQGFADASAWARGQAWGLYGYTMMFRETKKQEYLARARSIAKFIMSHPRLPEDKVPYWDFDAPAIPNAPRDASAAAVMASAFIELSGFVGKAEGREYFLLARQQLLAMSSPAYRAVPGGNGNFILMHSVGHLPGNSEIDVPLNYADYYFLEALLRYQALVNKMR
ncbi:MAG: glycoside hydrolase family 88 protein [Luteolibacter sp.]